MPKLKEIIIAKCESNFHDKSWNKNFIAKIEETSWAKLSPGWGYGLAQAGTIDYCLAHAGAITLLKWDLHIKLITFALLSQAVFDHFDTFPVGWVGGVNQD